VNLLFFAQTEQIGNIMQKLVVIMMVFMLNFLFAQQGVRELQRETKKVKEEGKRESALHAKEKERHQAFVKSSGTRLAGVKKQLQQVSNQTDSLRKEVERLRNKRRKLRNTTHWYQKQKENYALTLADRIDSLVPRLADDIPYKKAEHIEALKDIAAQLRRQSLTPEEALGRTWSLLLDRIALGYTAEHYPGYFDETGASLPGKYLRYGAIFTLFVSQDGEQVWYRTALSEQWISAAKNLELRAQLKETLKIAEGKKAPELAELPFPVMILQGGQDAE
jgi:hypothetical protein